MDSNQITSWSDLFPQWHWTIDVQGKNENVGRTNFQSEHFPISRNKKNLFGSLWMMTIGELNDSSSTVLQMWIRTEWWNRCNLNGGQCHNEFHVYDTYSVGIHILLLLLQNKIWYQSEHKMSTHTLSHKDLMVFVWKKRTHLHQNRCPYFNICTNWMRMKFHMKMCSKYQKSKDSVLAILNTRISVLWH